jgi:hypothetical protein
MTTTFKDGEQVEVACLGMKVPHRSLGFDGDQGSLNRVYTLPITSGALLRRLPHTKARPSSETSPGNVQ